MLRYCGPFLFLMAIPVLYYLAGPLAPIVVVVCLLAALIGAERIPSGAALTQTRSIGMSWTLPLLYVPLQIGVTIWAICAAEASDFKSVVALALPVGVTAGVFGMLCAHELAHSRSKWLRLVGLMMLTATSNRQFRIAHVYGHHRKAATERDAATAKLGESFFAFFVRTLPGQWREAWKFERRRCDLRGLHWTGNRVIHDVAATVLAYAIVAFGIGSRGAFFLLSQSAVAIALLELFNYVAHYGLVRKILDDGSLEPLSDAHSWNSTNALANLLIFNMGCHSDHHQRPNASYDRLRRSEDSLELPFGYAGSMVLALVPPLWRNLMDPAIVGLKSSIDVPGGPSVSPCNASSRPGVPPVL